MFEVFNSSLHSQSYIQQAFESCLSKFDIDALDPQIHTVIDEVTKLHKLMQDSINL